MFTKSKIQTLAGGRAKVAALTIALALLLTGIPSGRAIAGGEPGPAPVELTLERLSNLVERLEAELAASRNPVAERLEERLEGIAAGLEGLLDVLARPRDEESTPVLRLRILSFDLTMHRLLYLLDEILDEPDAPQHPDAREALEGLRRWIDEYVQAMTAGMLPEQARRFEAAAERAMRDLVQELIGVAERTQAPRRESSRPALARWVERLETLVFRLDGFMLGQFPEPALPETHPRAP